jgi:hypothetical protein
MDKKIVIGRFITAILKEDKVNRIARYDRKFTMLQTVDFNAYRMFTDDFDNPTSGILITYTKYNGSPVDEFMLNSDEVRKIINAYFN